MTEATPLPPRMADRMAFADQVRAVVQVVTGGPWDGRRVVDIDDLDRILGEPLPPASVYGAEVRADATSDGTLLVWLGCPECHEAQPASVSVKVRLTTERESQELKATFKGKARTHACGQTAAFGQDKGQMAAWDVDDITGPSEGDGAK